MVKIPEGWIETTLGEIAEISSSKRIFANEYKNEGVPFFRGKEITEKFLGNKISTELFITEEKYNEIKNNYGVPQENDLLLTSVGTLGNPYLVERNYKFYFKDGNITWFHDYNGIFYKYLFYRICSSLGKESLSHAQIGSTQQAYTIVALKKCSILLPPLPEQKAIAGVLSAFDDKIELLRAENQTLEEMGQTLFKERFGKYKVGDELPDGWKVGKLGDYCETVLGGTPSREKNEYWGGNIPWINSGKVNENRIVEASEYITEEGLSKSATKLMPKGTVLIAITGATLGQYSILCIDSCFNQSVVGIRESEKFKKEFLYYFIGATIKDLINNQTGGAQQHINKQVVDNHNMIIPTDEILEKYYEISEPIFNKITENLFQIKSLSKTRDQLLPKLMSGEVRVEF